MVKSGVSFCLYHRAWISRLFTIYDLPFTFFRYQRIKTPPQVTPPPNDANKTMSPVLMRPASTHSSNPIGIEADDVLPCSAMLEYTRSLSTLSLFATASVIR